MVEKLDPVISAVASVHAALKDLSSDDRGRVLASVQALLGLASNTTVQSNVGDAGGASDASVEVALKPARRLSLIELMQEKNPSTNAQKIALFAYYRDKYEGNPRFGRDDLRVYFGTAKESPPSNYDRDFVNAVRSGWVHEDGDDSYVTSKGIEVVESGFVGERKSTRKRTGTGKKGTARKKNAARRATGKKSTASRGRKKPPGKR